MADTPTWITGLSALLTPTIAIAVCWISFQQWRTAKAKLNLEIFEKRIEVYNDAVRALARIERDGGCLNPEPIKDIIIATNNARFLFGSEVSDHLGKLGDEISSLHVTELQLEDANHGERTELVSLKWTKVRYLSKEREELSKLFRPYMLIDDKRVRDFSEVFRDLNERRWSYADEKMKGEKPGGA